MTEVDNCLSKQNSIVDNSNINNHSLKNINVKDKTFTIKFKIGNSLKKIKLENASDTNLRELSYSISETYKVPFRLILKIVEEQYQKYKEKSKSNKSLDKNQLLNEPKQEDKIKELTKKLNEDYNSKYSNVVAIENHKKNNSKSINNSTMINNITSYSKLSKRNTKQYKRTSTYLFHESFKKIKGIGDRLYQKTQVEIERRQKNAERIKKEAEEHEMKECKIRPIKTEYSTFLNFKLQFGLIPQNRKRTRKINMSQISYKESSNLKRESQNYNNILNNINQHKDSFYKYKATSNPKTKEEIAKITERLYREHEHREFKRQKERNDYYNQICTFKPVVNFPTNLDETYAITNDIFKVELKSNSKKKINTNNSTYINNTTDKNNTTIKSSMNVYQEILTGAPFYQRVMEWKDKVRQSKDMKERDSKKFNLTNGEIMFNPIAYRTASSNMTISKIKLNETLLNERNSIKDINKDDTINKSILSNINLNTINNVDKHIHSKLYESHKTITAKKEEQIKKRENELTNMSKSKPINTKQKENNVSNDKLYPWIFNYLNPDNEKALSLDKSYVNNLELDKRASNAFSPLIKILGKNNQEYSQDEFVEKLKLIWANNTKNQTTQDKKNSKFNMLNNQLSFSEKVKIREFYKYCMRANSPKRIRQENFEKDQKDKFTFKPVVSDSSNNIFEKGRKYSNTSFFDRNKSLLENKKDYNDKHNEIKAIDELKECSFKPNLDKEQFSNNNSNLGSPIRNRSPSKSPVRYSLKKKNKLSNKNLDLNSQIEKKLDELNMIENQDSSRNEGEIIEEDDDNYLSNNEDH